MLVRLYLTFSSIFDEDFGHDAVLIDVIKILFEDLKNKLIPPIFRVVG
jgi:hypothetical protein